MERTYLAYIVDALLEIILCFSMLGESINKIFCKQWAVYGC